MHPGMFSGTIPSALDRRNFSYLYSACITWGGWGSNPRPADYEKSGPAHRMRYLHGYHGVVPPMALIAPFARVTRSTNRSTPYHGDHRMPATERYRRPADHRMPAPGGIRPPKEGPPLLTAEPLDLECRRNTCRASRRPLEIRRIRSSGGPAVAAVRKGWSCRRASGVGCSWPLLDLRQVALGDSGEPSKRVPRYVREFSLGAQVPAGSASWPGSSVMMGPPGRSRSGWGTRNATGPGAGRAPTCRAPGTIGRQ